MENPPALETDTDYANNDSGMSSLGGSKDETPERRPASVANEEEEAEAATYADKEDECEDEPDESIMERLWGLTEMFPEPVRNFCAAFSEKTFTATKVLYQFSCNASWIFFTSSMILFAPVVFETERAQMEEMQRTQQKQVLLGPGSAMSSGGSPALPPMSR